ncbi:hypothetical protein GIB67_011387 [Kingdonia uniflora]|uniref:Uncharacterized protein n=1 Tax=Kingdonia uniflora TaxID=39325 RepID=A0A7J7M3Q5_9MAGN|nr:hypothetical protein GIB67_011387 [Kingdonia uniflora]
MAEIHGVKFVLCLSFSLLLNLYFLWTSTRSVKELSWSKGAAVEAEVVASVSCSGHGRAFLDGVLVDGKPMCECNSCYVGADCSHFLDGCIADADSGDPLFLEPFWMKNAASSAVVVAGWHRMSYSFRDSHTRTSNELENHIRLLHAVIGNAVTEGRYIVIGVGSTQLLSAAVHALSPNGSASPAKLYKAQTKYFNSEDSKWQGDTSLWENSTSLSKNTTDTSATFVEFVTSPNNPDGKLMKAVLDGSSVKTIYDHAYYWPHFTAIEAPADENVMIFTLSKVTGHAGSRFGWAVVKDKDVYERIAQYINLNILVATHDTQLRALKLLSVALKGGGKELFGFGYKAMRHRWKKLSRSLSKSSRFSLQNLEPMYCTYFEEVTGPSPAYAWLKCEREEDKDCHEVLKSAGIIGREGSVFGAESRYVRLSLLKGQDDFDWLLERIDALVSQEYGSRSI